MMRHPLVTVRIASGGHWAEVVRAFACTPYDLELLVTELHRCGPGSRLEVSVDGDADVLADVTAALAPIGTRGIELIVGLAAPRADGLPRVLDDVTRGRVSPGDPAGSVDPSGAVGPRSDGRETPCPLRAVPARRVRRVRGTHDRATWKEDVDVSSTPYGR